MREIEMNAEDETFRKLKQPPYKQLVELMKNTYSTDFDLINFLEDNSWALEEYLTEYANEYVTSHRITDRKVYVKKLCFFYTKLHNQKLNGLSDKAFIA